MAAAFRTADSISVAVPSGLVPRSRNPGISVRNCSDIVSLPKVRIPYSLRGGIFFSLSLR